MQEQTLMPAYARDFRCIDVRCEYNCCHNWAIQVDEATYRRYMECNDDLIRDKIIAHTRITGDGTGYATIQMEDDGLCPFQMESGLCQIQFRLGEPYLGYTCANYPRRHYYVQGMAELSLNMSCPEAAQRALLQEGAMEFVYQPYSMPRPSKSSVRFASQSSYEHFFKTRMGMMSILRDRRLPFDERLVLCGLFLDTLSQAHPDDLARTIDQYEGYMAQNDVSAVLAQVYIPEDLHAQLVSSVMNAMFHILPGDVYGGILKRTADAFGFTRGMDSHQRVGVYLEAERRFHRDDDRWQLIFENYFINEIFGESVKCVARGMQSGHYSLTHAMWECYVQMCISYMMLKVHFCGVEHLGISLDEYGAVEIMYLFAHETFTHNSQLLQAVLHTLTANKSNTLAHMAALVKG